MSEDFLSDLVLDVRGFLACLSSRCLRISCQILFLMSEDFLPGFVLDVRGFLARSSS